MHARLHCEHSSCISKRVLRCCVLGTHLAARAGAREQVSAMFQVMRCQASVVHVVKQPRHPSAGTHLCNGCVAILCLPNVLGLMHLPLMTYNMLRHCCCCCCCCRYATQPRELAAAEPQHFLEYPEQVRASLQNKA
jgi:hypothetical protein